MSIVFLDFDGVLNDRGKEIVFDLVLYPDLVERLNAILGLSGAKVVVSSNWRREYPVETLRGILCDAGLKFPSRVIDVTPDHGFEAKRGDEIAEHVRRKCAKRPFVILDDRTDMTSVQSHLVRTRPDRGLRDRDVDLALAILGRG